jgi:hypothetical protein
MIMPRYIGLALHLLTVAASLTSACSARVRRATRATPFSALLVVDPCALAEICAGILAWLPRRSAGTERIQRLIEDPGCGRLLSAGLTAAFLQQL